MTPAVTAAGYAYSTESTTTPCMNLYIPLEFGSGQEVTHSLVPTATEDLHARVSIPALHICISSTNRTSSNFGGTISIALN